MEVREPGLGSDPGRWFSEIRRRYQFTESLDLGTGG